MKLWEKIWLNFEKFTADCDKKPKRTNESIVGKERRRKHFAVFGGAQEVPEAERPELYTNILRRLGFSKLGDGNFDADK